MVIDILLVLWFSVSPDTMLLLYAITLRDILIVRMGMFSSSSILSILSDTLILRFKGFVKFRGITKSECKCGKVLCGNDEETMNR